MDGRAGCVPHVKNSMCKLNFVNLNFAVHYHEDLEKFVDCENFLSYCIYWCTCILGTCLYPKKGVSPHIWLNFSCYNCPCTIFVFSFVVVQKKTKRGLPQGVEPLRIKEALWRVRASWMPWAHRQWGKLRRGSRKLAKVLEQRWEN